MKQKIIFFTFSEGTQFKYSKFHLSKLAESSGIFNSVFSFSFKDISNDFKKKYHPILSQKRGAGYWLWKIYFLDHFSKELNQDDIIIYMDAGSIFNKNGKKKLNEYLDMLKDSEYGNFRIKSLPDHIEKYYSTKQLFEYFKIAPDNSLANSTQFEAGHMIFKNNLHTKSYIQEFIKVIDFDNNLITDFYNNYQNNEFFIENRHDQSIFSLLSKLYGCVFVDNETDFRDNPSIQYDYPFLALRRKGHGLKDQIKLITNYKNERYKPKFF